jgi:glycosyltransferase involved in cell wall biosynthesis
MTREPPGLATDRPIPLVVLSAYDMAAWQDDHATGRRPDSLPYGLHHLEGHGFSLRWTAAVHRGPFTARVLRSPRFRLERRLGRFFQYPSRAAIVEPVLASRQISNAAVVLSIFEEYAFFYAWLRRHRVSPFARVPLVVVACWAAERLPMLPPSRLRIVRRLATEVDHWIVFSENQVAVFRDQLDIPPSRVTVVPFGVDENFFRPSAPSQQAYVLVAGKDSGRDFRVFLDAVSGTSIPTKLVCPPWSLDGQPLPSNVEFVGPLDNAGYRDVLAKAAISVIPTKTFAYPTGQSVLLESMSSGKPCIVTDTPAIRDYVDDGRTAILVPPGDPGAMRREIEGLLMNPRRAQEIGRSARSAVETHFSSRAMWGAIAPVLIETAARTR